MYEFENAYALARTEVEYLNARLFKENGDGFKMSYCKIDYVNIVSDSGSVGRGIVVAEYAQMVSFCLLYTSPSPRD